MPDRPSRERGASDRIGMPRFDPLPAEPPERIAEPEEPPPPEIPVFPGRIPLEQQYAPYPEAHRRIPWGPIAAVALALVLAVLGLRYLGPRLRPEPIALAMSEHDGQIQIQWNRSANSVAGASGGSLEITDGQEKQVVNLAPKELASGSFLYVRKTGDVQVHMTVTGSAGQVEEGSRFVGRPPETVDGNEFDVLKVQRDALQDEITRLRAQNAQQAEQIQQLERTLTVLRTRMGISQAK